MRAVEVDDAENAAVPDQRHHQFRARGRIARDVIGEGMHVFDQHGPALLDRRAAHAAADRDAHTGRIALKRTQHQLVRRSQEVEAGPVQVRQRREQQRRGVGRIGDRIALAAAAGLPAAAPTRGRSAALSSVSIAFVANMSIRPREVLARPGRDGAEAP